MVVCISWKTNLHIIVVLKMPVSFPSHSLAALIEPNTADPSNRLWGCDVVLAATQFPYFILILKRLVVTAFS